MALFFFFNLNLKFKLSVHCRIIACFLLFPLVFQDPHIYNCNILDLHNTLFLSCHDCLSYPQCFALVYETFRENPYVVNTVQKWISLKATFSYRTFNLVLFVICLFLHLISFTRPFAIFSVISRTRVLSICPKQCRNELLNRHLKYCAS